MYFTVAVFQWIFVKLSSGCGKQQNKEIHTRNTISLQCTRRNRNSAKTRWKSADQGLAAGEFGLASMYAHGRGVAHNASKAAI